MGFRWSTTRRFLRRLRTRGAHGRLANSLLWKLAGGAWDAPNECLERILGCIGWLDQLAQEEEATN